MAAHRTILVVDDSPAQRYAIGRMLERAGYGVLHAANGTDGFNAVAEHEPDLVLLDIRLPDVNGVMLAERLKACAETRRVPIVLYSATSTPYLVSQENARAIGAFLTTPIEPEHLLHVVNGTLARAAKT